MFSIRSSTWVSLGAVGILTAFGGASASESPLLDDLAPEIVSQSLQAISDGKPPLQAIRSAVVPYVFDAGDLQVRTDPRWFQTLPTSGPGAPMLELRRWPGDTVVTFFAVEPPPEDAPDTPPPLPPGRFDGPTELADGIRQWSGHVVTPAGPRPAYWIERKIPDGAPALGALLIPGDAGLGEESIAARTEEAAWVAYGAQVDPSLWRGRPPTPRSRTLDLPSTGPVPGDKTEEGAPWQVIAAQDFTLGLPPGFRARRVDAAVPAPVAVAGQQLWLRGRFTDTQGTTVIVGDGAHPGYVARIADPSPEWKKGIQPPLGSPAAEPVRGERFSLLEERTGARTARAERWRAGDFSGEWLVFRYFFDDHGFEMGLPVLGGRQSESLFWIPASWRAAGEPPAPPPVDPAARFGIRFERLTPSGKRERPWSEGFLEAPGLRAEFPKGHWPSASLRSSDGFPIRVVDGAGQELGRIERVAPAAVEGFAPDSGGWGVEKKPSAFRAARAYRRGAELLLIAEQGHGYLFVRAPDVGERAEWWDRLLGTIRLTKPGR